MAKLKRWGLAILAVTAILWLATYLLVGPSAFPTWVLVLAGAAVGSLISLDWAASYT